MVCPDFLLLQVVSTHNSSNSNSSLDIGDRLSHFGSHADIFLQYIVTNELLWRLYSYMQRKWSLILFKLVSKSVRISGTSVITCPYLNSPNNTVQRKFILMGNLFLFFYFILLSIYRLDIKA